jgi:hypothetical protein
MFAADEVSIPARFDVAAAQLCDLINRGGLRSACEAAYAEGLAAELSAKPSGRAQQFSQLVRVLFLEPAYRGGTMTVALRWEATGVAGGVFPILDANLILARDGDGHSLLALTGTYRPPFSAAAPGTASMHRLATAANRSLLAHVAGTIATPDLQRQPAADAAAGQTA